MAAFFWSVGSTINRLRIRSCGQDPQQARLQSELLVSALSLQPACLPPAAILYVRLMRDPRPGLQPKLPGDISAARAWEQSLQASLEDFAHHAARPVEGAVPANASAVLFHDRSEQLACLAMDWCAGEVITHWWWHSLLHQSDVTGAVLGAWLESPESVPAALNLLAARDQAVQFAQKLSAPVVLELALAVTRAFGLSELHGWLKALPTRYAQPPPVSVEMNEGSAATQPTPVRPWNGQWDEPAAASLSLERQIFAGICVLLQRAPHIVRAPAFARQVEAWHTAMSWAVLAPASASNEQGNARNLNLENRPGSPLEVPEDPHSVLQQASLPVRVLSSDLIVGSAKAPPELTVDASSEPVGRLVIDTGYGACLYLINLGLYLGLYSDFATPLAPGLTLPIWEFLALLAVELAGEGVRSDPLWALLASLAGRGSDESPGKGFEPPEHLSLDEWLFVLVAKVRSRLRLALGAGDDDLAGFFRARARIEVTAERLDAFFSLAELPVEIRLSGLDRDPGWVPAAGKTIAFHFEGDDEVYYVW